MPGSATTIRQERFKKTGGRPNPLGLFTINEEDEQQKNGNPRRLKESEGIQSKIQEKRSTSLSRPTSAISLQSSIISGAKPDLHPILKVDERQKLARERRLEREKQLAARESFWLEKEEKARQYYEKHLEERKRKLEEQRIKEEKRRAAVDEKRRQRIEEEKERHEAVVRRTMERSQKSRQKLNRWPWGGALQSNTSIDSSDPDRRSVSTVNLSKHLDPVINKRLSSSSATLLNSPDRARRLQLSPWESSVVSRLLMPTHSFLARSKSTAALSGDSVIPICPRSASCSPISPQSYKTVNYRSAERPKLSVMAPEAVGRRRTTHSPLVSSIDKKEKDRENEREQALLNPSFNIKRSHSPSNPKIRSPAPSPVWLPQKTPAFFPGASKQTPSSPSFNKVLSSSQRPPSPGNVRPIKRETQSEKDPEKELEKANEESTECKAPLPATGESATEEMFSGLPESVQAGGLSPAPLPAVPTPSASSKTTAGTTNPEEATRVLSEKRRLAREQREREEQERKEKEEEKRQKKEEMAQRKAEERARREEKALREEAERKQREEEQQREKEEQLQRLAEEKEQRERSEAERLQKQKEEEEVRLQEEAERIRLEREKHFQREEQERLERKKRLEEIMKRTRRSEAADKQSNAQRNGEISKTPEEPDTPPSSLQSEQESQLQYTREVPRNGEPATPAQMLMTHHPVVTVDSTLNTEKQANENGVSVQNDSFEEIINLPVESKPSRLESLGTGGSNNPPINLNPVIAFEETGTLGPLPQVDSVQTQQTAEVI
ncbi:ensconsin isoform X2 [Rhinatrema bivittatum]|uniref:ensconsin isoform X2 n=1 Tax=Rhinatrema bivittatum TaxID=194408 RepID=UPI00112AC207|nr:ensconsin isoform X2 [Rhinatrema bivittatum]